MPRPFPLQLLAITAAPALAQPVPDPLSQAERDAIDTLFAPEADRFDSGVALVLLRNGKVFYENTWHGFDESIAWPIASSTKWISGLAIARQIAEDPGYDVTSAVGEFIPSFEAQPLKAGITLAELFTHSSGISPRPTYNRDVSLTMEQAADLIAGVPLLGPPGGQIFYGGCSMQVAGRMTELRTGEPWADFAASRLFGPLEMARTDYLAFTSPPGTPTDNPNVAGSIRTTLADYARFLAALDEGGLVRARRVIPAAAYDTLFTDYTGLGIEIESSPYQVYEPFAPGSAAFRTGFGCFIDPTRIRPDGSVGWATSAGAFGTNAWVDSDRDFTGVMFTYVIDRTIDGQPVPYNPATRFFLEEVRPLVEASIEPVERPVFDPDLNRDGVVSFLDVAAYPSLFFEVEPVIDIATPFGTISQADVTAFVDAFFAGRP
ncbi:MAG: serine hydrolase domain-containing protein [Planctomycetota bacterium]